MEMRTSLFLLLAALACSWAAGEAGVLKPTSDVEEALHEKLHDGIHALDRALGGDEPETTSTAPKEVTESESESDPNAVKTRLFSGMQVNPKLWWPGK